MRVLIVVGNCLRVNSSANLCHLAYIKGFVENSCDVTVLSMAESGQIIDESIILPKGAEYVYCKSSILLKFIKPDVRKSLNRDMENKKKSTKSYLYTKVRSFILNSYGPFGYNQSWVNQVEKSFKSEHKFDLILSLSSPVTSHVAAHLLLKKNSVQCNKYIQLWEDPWQYDLYKEKIDKKLLKLEYEITQYADEVLYVSPITADIQKRIFPLSERKINWLPLPYYYKDEYDPCFNFGLHFGYFGDYFPNVRNLLPFYNTANKLDLKVDICGMPDTLLQQTDLIQIHPRLPLHELKEYESKANVLVFVCNIKGGQIPGKIYQYSATKKKILFILDGTPEEIDIIKSWFEKFNRYYFCLNTEESIEKGIKELDLSSEIEDAVIEFFNPKNITKLILDKCSRDKEVNV